MVNLKSSRVQTFLGGAAMIGIGKLLFAGIAVTVPEAVPMVGGLSLQAAAMLVGFGACTWALKHPAGRRELEQQLERASVAPSSAPPALSEDDLEELKPTQRTGKPPKLPPTLIVFLLGLVALGVGCAGGETQEPDWSIVRDHANVMRVEVNAVVDELRPLAPLLDVACALRGRESSTCKGLRTAWDVARAAVSAAQGAIDLYDVTGLELDTAQRGARRVRAAADRLQDALERVGKVAGDAMDRQGDEGGPGAARPGEGAQAGEEGGGAQGPGAAARDDRAGAPPAVSGARLDPVAGGDSGAPGVGTQPPAAGPAAAVGGSSPAPAAATSGP